MSAPDNQRIIQALSTDQSPLRDEGVTLAIDHLLSSKLKDVVELGEVANLVLLGLTTENMARTIERHVKPGWKRYSERAAKAHEPVQSLVPPVARDKIKALVVETKPPRAAWAEDIVDQALLRRLLAPVWVNVLVQFGKRVLGGTGESGGSATGRVAAGIAGRLGRSVQERAERLVDAGRSVMGGLGAEVERRVQASAKDFSEGAASAFKDALRDRLASEEGRELVAAIGGGVVDHVMRTHLSAFQVDASAFPVDTILDTVPHIVPHAVAGAFVKDIVFAEVSSFIALEGDRSLKDLLSEAGLHDEARALMIRRGSSIVQGLVASEAFAGWLERLLDA
jgi:hypothetical protein